MKRLWILGLICVLVGCGYNTKREFTDSELMVICDAVDGDAEAQIDQMKYEDVYGTSDDEREQTKEFLKIYNRLRERSLKKHKMKKNIEIEVTGIISYIEELRDGEICFHLGDPWSGKKSFTSPVICSTTEQDFLNYKKGDTVTIEGVFFKTGRKEEHVSDCKLLTK